MASARAQCVAEIAGRALAQRTPDRNGSDIEVTASRLEQFSCDVELARISGDVYRRPGGQRTAWL
jgi:hypothetical protein